MNLSIEFVEIHGIDHLDVLYILHRYTVVFCTS